MLFDKSIPRGHERRVCIRTRSPALGQVLAGLLDAWQYSLEDEQVEGALLLAEEGSCEAPVNQQVLWLGHSSYSSRDRLPLPLGMEELYSSLEHRFHRPPRRHMRMDIELPARVSCRGDSYESFLTSLSDRGGRLLLPRELARDEGLELEFSLAGHPMKLEGAVIYSFQRPRLTEEVGYDTGVLFTRQCQSECDQLREFILARYLSRLQKALSAEVLTAGLQFFTLPPALQQCFAGSRVEQ